MLNYYPIDFLCSPSLYFPVTLVNISFSFKIFNVSKLLFVGQNYNYKRVCFIL